MLICHLLPSETIHFSREFRALVTDQQLETEVIKLYVLWDGIMAQPLASPMLNCHWGKKPYCCP